MINIEQTACGYQAQILPMSLAGWYLHKADQCAQMAKEATEPQRRADYNKEQKVWRQLALEIEQEQPQFKTKFSN